MASFRAERYRKGVQCGWSMTPLEGGKRSTMFSHRNVQHTAPHFVAGEGSSLHRARLRSAEVNSPRPPSTRNAFVVVVAVAGAMQRRLYDPTRSRVHDVICLISSYTTTCTSFLSTHRLWLVLDASSLTSPDAVCCEHSPFLMLSCKDPCRFHPIAPGLRERKMLIQFHSEADTDTSEHNPLLSDCVEARRYTGGRSRGARLWRIPSIPM